jgi:hypothetical protein
MGSQSKLPIVAFITSLVGFAFALGVAIGAYEVFPYQHLKHVINSVETVVADRGRLVSNLPTGFISKRRYQGSGVTIHDTENAQPGFTLLSGFFEDLPEIRLIRLDGSVVQRWPISYSALFPSSHHIFPKEDRPSSDWNAAVHGIHISPDGSILFNLDAKGTAKVDRCGKPIWTLEHMTHHSVELSLDGSYWIPSVNIVDESDKSLPHFKTPYRDDTILRVSSDGQVLTEKSVHEIFVENGLFAVLVSNGRFPTRMNEYDALHVNDIEELKPDIANSFPAFEAGDLLLSMRHLNLLLVVDPDDWTVRWYKVGPWLRQHDPDFQADGRITVFNNNSDDTEKGEILGGSNIMSLRPAASVSDLSVIFGDGEGEWFFTNTQGKHQRLENGNFLVAEYYAGRVFEFNAERNIVWQYINVFDEDHAAKISGAERYPENYFSITDWRCSHK